MTHKLVWFRLSVLTGEKMKGSWHVSRTPVATVRFYWRGLWRSWHPIPADRPLPRPTHDF